MQRLRAQKAQFLFFPSAPFWPHEGPLVQSCFTGQLPGTDCLYTGQSPNVLRKLTVKPVVLVFTPETRTKCKFKKGNQTTRRNMSATQQLSVVSLARHGLKLNLV